MFESCGIWFNVWLFCRATGDDTRSLCTTVCKWTYLGHAHMQYINDKKSRDMEACGWDDEFWEEIGLGDLVEGHHAKIGIHFIRIDLVQNQLYQKLN